MQLDKCATVPVLVGGRGRPVLYLHGFPDHPPTAAAFLDRLAAHDRRVVAPWLRGYAPASLAGPFDIDSVAADAAALITELGAPCDVVGHDWGAVITYALCALHPDLVRRAVTIAVPHPLTFLRLLGTPAQARRSWYMGFFHLPGAPYLAQRDDFALIDRLWRTWSPGFTLPAADRRELNACLAASWPYPIGYYRAMVRPLRDFRQRVKRMQPPIATPLLQLHGERDGCIAPVAPEIDAHRFLHREHAVIANAGHFVPHERPDALAERIAAWLA